MSDASMLVPVRLTFELALASTAILLALGTPLAWWLARTRAVLRPLVEAVVTLPLVLPPTVLGFYLLLFLGPRGPLAALDLDLVFSFPGLVVGSVLFSAPFVVNPLKDAFESIPEGQLESAATLGASPFDRFLSVVVPLAAPSFATAAALGFAHTVGEFGVVLMIGGNIPGETQVLSIAIYDRVEQLDYAAAHAYSAGLVLFSFAALAVVAWARRRGRVLG